MQSHGSPDSKSDILSVNNIELVYDGAILVLKGVSLTVPAGSLVALLGANGAGKTSTLKSISRLVQSERGELTRGTISFDGEDTGDLPADALVKRGCVQVMEGRRCFGHLTIEENLLTGAYTRRDGAGAVKADLERIYHFFPRLKERRRSQAGYTSGGEQQMCAIGRALMSQPKMILLDEPSMGLAPRVVEEIFEIVASLNEKLGISYLVAEQNALIALKYARHGYVLENGRVVLEGSADELRSNDDIREFYLGVTGEDRVSFRDAKSYSRRKRWLG